MLGRSARSMQAQRAPRSHARPARTRASAALRRPTAHSTARRPFDAPPPVGRPARRRLVHTSIHCRAAPPSSQVDEAAANAAGSRPAVLASYSPHADGMGRVFSFGTDGNRMVKHVTTVETSCADGTMRSPYLIKTRGGAEGARKAAAKRKAGEKVAVMEPTATDKEHLGESTEDNLYIGVGVSPNGSMTLELFHVWIDHFLEHCLLPGQGKGGQPAAWSVSQSASPPRRTRPSPPACIVAPRLSDCGQPPAGGEHVFLFLDGHASRWSLAGLAKLRQNNVHVICVPSHTTVWSQPNDNGINAAEKVRSTAPRIRARVHARGRAHGLQLLVSHGHAGVRRARGRGAGARR